MTITQVASFTPTDRRPSAYALSSPVALEVRNGTKMTFTIFAGRGLRDTIKPGERLIYAQLDRLSYSLSWILVTPTDEFLKQAVGTLDITTYGNGDALPSRGSYTPGNFYMPNYTFEDNTDKTRPLKALNAVEFGVTEENANNGPALRAAADVARVIGGADIYLPPGVLNVTDTVTSTDNSSMVAAVLLGDNTSLIGAGPGKTKIRLGAWAGNPLISSLPTPTREFWVSTTGNNGNAGTKASPFRDVSYAVLQCTQSGGGYRVHVAPGSYSDVQIDTTTGVSAAGTQANPNVIISDVPWGAKINCTSSGSSARAFYLRTGWWVVGFEITNSANVGANMISCDGSFSAAIGNYIHDCGQSAGEGVEGVTVTGPPYTQTGIIIANNYIRACGPTGGGFPSHGIYPNGNGTIVANNLIVNQQGAGIHSFHTPINIVIVGNTVFNCGAGSNDGGILVGSNDAGWTVSGILVANNILVNNTQYGLRELASGGAVMGACTYTNNLMFGNSVGAFSPMGGSPNTNANAQTTDPLFVNQQTDGTGDFRLRAGSPAIDNGSDSSMPATWGSIDLLGNIRPVGTHRDIGCYEYLAWGYPGVAAFANYNGTSGNKDISLRDITIDGNAANATGVGAGLAFCRTQRLSIRNVLIKNILGGRDTGVGDPPALLLDYCSDADISGVQICTDDGGPAGSGITARYCFDLSLRGIDVQGVTHGNGISLDTCNAVRLDECSVGGAGGHGILVRSVTDFTIAESDTGLLAPVVAVFPYSANQAVGNGGHGLYMVASSGDVIGCRSQRNTGSGFWIDGAGNVDVISCEAKNNTADGFTIGGSVGGGSVRINGLRSRSNTGYGVQILTAALAQLTRITDHVIASNTAANFRILSTNYAVTGNISSPVVPATTVSLTNPYPFDIWLTVTGGTVTVISVDGAGIGHIPPADIRLRAGGTIAITYTVVPSWTWYVEN